MFKVMHLQEKIFDMGSSKRYLKLGNAGVVDVLASECL